MSAVIVASAQIVVEVATVEEPTTRPVWRLDKQRWDDSDDTCERILAWLREERETR